MFCTNCGKEIKEEWNKCPYCSNLIASEKEEGNDNKAELTNHKIKEMHREITSKKNKKHIGLKIGLTVLACIIIFFIIIMGTGNDESVQQEEKVKSMAGVDLEKYIFDNITVMQKDYPEIQKGDSGLYSDKNGIVSIACNNSNVPSQITISGQLNESPQFHGIALGMKIDEAKEKLVEPYVIQDEGKGHVTYFNNITNTYISMEFSETDEIVLEISYFTKELFGESEIQSETEAQSAANSETEVSNEEIIQNYINSCAKVDGEELARNPSMYEGKEILIESMIHYLSTSQTYYIDTDNAYITIAGDNVLFIDDSGQQIENVIEGDKVYVAGTYMKENKTGVGECIEAKCIILKSDKVNENEQSETQSIAEVETDSLVNEYIFADSNRRELATNEIEQLTDENKQMAINEIYARYGRKFNDTNVQDYFNSKSWYKGVIEAKDFDEDKLLNQFEKSNIKKLVNMSEEKGNNNFIGITGSYRNGTNIGAGMVNITGIDDTTVSFTLCFDGGGNSASGTGNIVDDHTVIFYLNGLTLTFIWEDVAKILITREGGTGFTDIDEITDNKRYMISEYYHTS